MTSKYDEYEIAQHEELTVTDYFHKMQELNGDSMAFTLTAEYFGMSEEEVVDIIEEGK